MWGNLITIVSLLGLVIILLLYFKVKISIDFGGRELTVHYRVSLIDKTYKVTW